MKNIHISGNLLNYVRYLPAMIFIFFFIVASNNLKASEVTCSTVTIFWTAPGDDNNQGTADEYDIRYSTTTITETNWNSAIQISDEPAPQLAGTQESHTIEDLEPGTTYYFAIKTSDEAPNLSALSNIGNATTDIDTEAPAAIANLLAFNPSINSVELSWTAPGDDINEGTAIEYEIRYSTSYITEANWSSAIQVDSEPSPQPAGSPESFTVIGLQSSTTYFFAIKAADEMQNWSNLSNITNSRTEDEQIPPNAVTDLAASNPTENSITLTWTAPGDDGDQGTATEYDIRYSISMITESNWMLAIMTWDEPTPQPAGSQESFVVENLAMNTTYYFAIKTADEVFNLSALSNVAIGTTDNEHIAPDPIADLQTVDSTGTSITLAWTAPGDDGDQGTASEYDIRYSISVITEANWNSAIQVIGEPSPQIAGSQESFVVNGLDLNTTYYFGIKTADEGPTWSALSNIVNATTENEQVEPGAIADLITSNPAENSITLTWTAPGNDGYEGTASQYDIRYSTALIDNDNWSSANQVDGEPSPQPAGNQETFIVNDLNINTQYYFAIKTADDVPNWSTLSNIANGTTLNEQTAPANIADLQTSDATETSVLLIWTAPGDDGNNGTADKYDIRYSASMITEASWDSANQANMEPSPQPAGSQESFTVLNLDLNTVYYFAIKTADEVPNWSDLSNIAVDTTDNEHIPPNPVANLQITNLDEHSVTLTWTATGDDGGEGTASLYDVRYSLIPITQTNWYSRLQADDEPIPQPAGNQETFTINDLQSQTTYYIAIKAADEVPNWSGLSNIVSGMTPDLTMPMPIYDLIAVTGENEGEIDISWTAPGDDSLIGLASEYIIKTSNGLITALNWDSANAIANPPVPVEPGSLQTFTITGLEPAQLYFVAIKTIDDYGNISDMSVVDSATSMFDWSPDSIYENGSLPDRFALEQNYPNPFNPSTSINFSLPEPANVKLDIYNSIGQKVITLVESNYPAGFYTEQWNGRDTYNQSLASGVYFYIIQAGQFTNTKKMMLIK